LISLSRAEAELIAQGDDPADLGQAVLQMLRARIPIASGATLNSDTPAVALSPEKSIGLGANYSAAA
jgi:hypothetical protein